MRGSEDSLPDGPPCDTPGPDSVEEEDQVNAK